VVLATTSASVVGPGKPVTFIATATADISVGGYRLGIYDQTSGTELTYCSRGTACSVTLTKSNAGARSIVAYVATLPAASTNTSSVLSAALPPAAVLAQSAPITATWLGVTLDANTTRPQMGGSVVMRATANVDVTSTPWSIGIYDQQGELVSASCKSGSTCAATVKLGPGATPFFTAVIGAARQSISNGSSSSALVQLVHTAQSRASLINIQAQSKAVQPNRLLWGVDSCKTIAADASGGGGLYGQVTRWYGSPDFWARYLTNTYNCPGITPTEIAAAAYRNIGILPIFNNYDCSAVRTYKVGLLYANEAVAAAENLGVSTGSVLAIDIEPYGEQCPGAARVDAGFIEGWYDGITLAGYAPLYYGNGTAGSEFATSWCRAAAARPEVALNSYLWSFEPSLYGRFTRAKAPSYSPEQPACAGNEAVWQYSLSSGARPDVDSDEALSSVPFWYPQGGG
ncbi:MAG TPA: glycoside hydrolase domain-containing protein, partial [Clostridia bacterium]|nr:glycoside hydrolase domain-containing protein [Clostridia bacterium]